MADELDRLLILFWQRAECLLSFGRLWCWKRGQKVWRRRVARSQVAQHPRSPF